MDPLSIIAGTTGTVAFAITSAIMLNDFISSILDAPADIAAIARDVDALTKILDTLQGWLEKDVIRPAAARSLSGSLNACVTCMNQLRLALQPFTKVNPNDRGTFKWRSFGWTFKKQEIRDLRDKLQHSKATLSMSLGIINTYAIESGNQELSKQIESGNEAIRNDLSTLQQDLRVRKERKLDLASTGGDHGSLFNGTDAGIPLRRYIEDLPPLSHPWAGASDIGEILSLRSMDDGDSRPPTRPASPDVVFEEPESLPRMLSPLHRATVEDDIRKVMELLATGADVNEKGLDGRTPLHVCAQNNNTVMAEVLLYKSASINVADDSGNEPLRIALDAGSTEMACMLLSHGGSVQTLSRFIVDVARRERMGEKRLILRCFGCVADEGKEDELLDLLSNATHGAPASLESAVVEILHDAESSFMSETVGLAKSFSERKAKLPVESSEQGRDGKHESDPDSPATQDQIKIRSIWDPNGRERGQTPESRKNPEENLTRSLEGALTKSSEQDGSSGIVRSGTSVQPTSMAATCEDDSSTFLDHRSQPRNAIYGVDEFYAAGYVDENVPPRESVSLPVQKTGSSKELQSVVLNTKAPLDSIPGTARPDDDALTVVKTISPHTIPRKPLLQRQFSWEAKSSDDIASISHTAQPANSTKITELQLSTARSTPHPPPAGHLFGIALQELCTRQGCPVPQVVLDCISVLEQDTFHLSGIYQHPPEPLLVEKMRDFMENGSQLTEYGDEWLRVHRAAVLGLLKQFLRELPDSLLPYAYHDVLMELAQEAKSVCLQQLKAIIYALPLSHYATLRVIMVHLKKVTDHRRQASLERASNTPGPDAVYLTSKEIEEMFAPLVIHPAKTIHWTGTNSASRMVIVNLVLNECEEFLQDGTNELNVPNDSANAARLSLGFPKI